MSVVGQKVKTLRESVGLSQAKLAELAGVTQPSINRYENINEMPPLAMLLWYADYFDVSLDYIFGRTDQPQGKLYSFQPEALRKRFATKDEMRRFIEFCFEPGTSGNEKLKAALAQMVEDGRP